MKFLFYCLLAGLTTYFGAKYAYQYSDHENIFLWGWFAGLGFSIVANFLEEVF